MRKRATEGTKISTSLSITKKTVSTSKRAERLCNTRRLPFRPGAAVPPRDLIAKIAGRSAEAGEKAHERPRARREEARREEGAGRPLAGFAAGRIGHDEIGERACLQPARDRQGPGKDQIAGIRPENRGAENAAAAPQHELHHASGRALALRAVVLGERPALDDDCG